MGLVRKIKCGHLHKIIGHVSLILNVFPKTNVFVKVKIESGSICISNCGKWLCFIFCIVDIYFYTVVVGKSQDRVSSLWLSTHSDGMPMVRSYDYESVFLVGHFYCCFYSIV